MAKTAYIEPGSPWENGFFERFNALYRVESLNSKIPYGLRKARILIEHWRIHLSTVRPHNSLSYRALAPESVIPVDQGRRCPNNQAGPPNGGSPPDPLPTDAYSWLEPD